jgi:uncharacterized protein
MNVRILIFVILVFAFILVGKIYYDTYTIEVRHYRIDNNRLAVALDGKKVAFVSDLHTKSYGPLEKEVISILQKENPDYVFLGGDYISFRGSYETVFSFLGNLKGAYAVLGNTDYSNENGSCLLCHEGKSTRLKKDPGVVFLRNSGLYLNNGEKKINLLGVDDPVNKKSDVSEAIRKCDRTAPTILLAHSPEVFEEAVQQGIDLVLCGHNHGGQVFLAKYLNGRILIDPSLKYIEGFFQKGETLMYVGRGIGNSFLPFRLGVKPEVTFFEFASKTGTMTNSSEGVSNTATENITAGYFIANLMGLFDYSNLYAKPYKTKHRVNQTGKLFDFEAEEELDYLNWECRKWFEMSKEHVTSGEYSLRVSLPAGQYPGIYFKDVEKDWSAYRHFKMEVYNPEAASYKFHIRIDDKKSGWEYADRFDQNITIKKGMNHISIPLDSLKANIAPRSLDLKNIKRLMFFIPGNDKKRSFHIDNIRLE